MEIKLPIKKKKPDRKPAQKPTVTPVRPKSNKVNYSVRIDQADNGWIVSRYDDRLGKELKQIAKTKAEAKNIAIKMLGL